MSLKIIVFQLFCPPSPHNRGGEEYCGLGGGNGTLPELLQQPAHAAEAETLIKECQRGERSLKIVPHDRKINLLAVDPVHMEKSVHLDKSKTL